MRSVHDTYVHGDCFAAVYVAARTFGLMHEGQAAGGARRLSPQPGLEVVEQVELHMVDHRCVDLVHDAVPIGQAFETARIQR